jgi:tRNA threonylcarbamoyladenosine biosynthesis protein TsaE
MHSFEYLANDEAATVRLGEALAKCVLPGAVVTLEGPLGAGKTRLVQAWGTALGVDPRDIASPTFVLCHEYHGRLDLYHFDAYRAKNAAEFWDLGIDDYYRAGGIVLIEWASRVAECLPDERLDLEIQVIGENSRRFQFIARGDAAECCLDRLRQTLTGSD